MSREIPLLTAHVHIVPSQENSSVCSQLYRYTPQYYIQSTP